MKTIITPEKAKELLENNAENQRKINKQRIKKYAEDMKNGSWVYNGETIIVSKSGKLIDGQHRLMAVVESGCEIETAFVDDVPDEQDGIDTFCTINSENRNNADVLYIDGFKEETSLFVKYISLHKAFLQQKLSSKPSGIRYKNHEIIDLARQEDYKEALEVIERAKRLQKRCDLLQIQIWILAVRVLGELEKGNEFLEKLADCDLEEDFSPITAYKKFLYKIAGVGGIAYTKMRWIGLFRAYKEFVEGKEVLQMRIKSTQPIDYPSGVDYEEA